MKVLAEAEAVRGGGGLGVNCWGGSNLMADFGYFSLCCSCLQNGDVWPVGVLQPQATISPTHH